MFESKSLNSWLVPCKLVSDKRDFLTISLFTISVLSYTLWQGRYNLDSHHWGLMLSNARDLSNGLTPYKDIFVSYGILTTVTHAFALLVFGERLLSLILITALFYSAGLAGTYFLARDLSGSRTIALSSYIICASFHPLVIYPWSNYIAFPFITFGLWLLLRYKVVGRHFFLSGLFLGLAMLCREGLFLAICSFLVLFSSFQCYTKTAICGPTHLLVLWAGFLLPVAIFFAYLWQVDLMTYWLVVSYELPKLYASAMLPHGLVGGIHKWLIFLAKGLIRLHPHAYIIVSIYISIFITIYRFLFLANKPPADPRMTQLALISLLLTLGSLHSPEYFRMATGPIIGIIVLLSATRHFRYQLLLSLSIVPILVGTSVGFNSGNYFFPSSDVRSSAVRVDTPGIFEGQLWSSNASHFYKSLDRDLGQVKATNCGVNYYYSTSHDAFISTVSPFRLYGLMPVGDRDNLGVERLRKDLNLDARIREERDVVILLQTNASERSEYRVPDGYFVWKRYTVPKSAWFDGEYILSLVLPKTCEKKL